MSQQKTVESDSGSRSKARRLSTIDGAQAAWLAGGGTGGTPGTITGGNLDVEDGYIRSLEAQRSTASAGSGHMVWDASLPGEHPLLGNVPMSSLAFGGTDARPPTPRQLHHNNGTDATERLRTLAQRSRHLRFSSRSNSIGKLSIDSPLRSRNQSLAADPSGSQAIPTAPLTPPPPPPPPPVPRVVRAKKRGSATAGLERQMRNLSEVSDMFQVRSSIPPQPRPPPLTSLRRSVTTGSRILRPRTRTTDGPVPGFRSPSPTLSSKREAFQNQHRRIRSQLFEGVGGVGAGEQKNLGFSQVAVAETDTDRLIYGAAMMFWLPNLA